MRARRTCSCPVLDGPWSPENGLPLGLSNLMTWWKQHLSVHDKQLWRRPCLVIAGKMASLLRVRRLPRAAFPKGTVSCCREQVLAPERGGPQCRSRNATLQRHHMVPLFVTDPSSTVGISSPWACMAGLLVPQCGPAAKLFPALEPNQYSQLSESPEN